MLTEKHNLNVQLMELSDKLNRSQSDHVIIKKEVEQTKSSEQDKEGLVPIEIVGSLPSQEEKTVTPPSQAVELRLTIRYQKQRSGITA